MAADRVEKIENNLAGPLFLPPDMQTVPLRPGRVMQVPGRVGGLMRAGRFDAEVIGDPEIAYKTSTAEPGTLLEAPSPWRPSSTEHERLERLALVNFSAERP